MKRIFTIAALFTFVLFAFSSCYKSHSCVCQVKTVTQDTKDTIKSSTTHHTIKGTQEDADDACKYYETEEDYLKRYAIVYHYCAIDDDYKK